MNMVCDLFCRVVDNFGDAGVCWRLARQLANEYRWQMRLWIDDLAPLGQLRPGIDPHLTRQSVDSVDIRQWHQSPSAFPAIEPGNIVIEAFACVLPAGFVDEMNRAATEGKRLIWLNLEYLSAEPWVAGCHGLPSPQGNSPVRKFFFFPGFTTGTGGLIRERDLLPGLAPDNATLEISLFCYDNPALPDLLTAWSQGQQAIRCRVAPGWAQKGVSAWLGRNFAEGTCQQVGQLRLEALSFLPQTAYDRLLASCHVNFVRGEDSLVRAQWAERAWIWQAYPQAEGAHWPKIQALLDLYTQGLDQQQRAAVINCWRAWNGDGSMAGAWMEFCKIIPQLIEKAPDWAKNITFAGHLAENLVKFCAARL